MTYLFMTHIYILYVWVWWMKWWFFSMFWLSSFLLWFTSHGVPPFTSIYHETASHCADMVASDAMSQRQQPLVQRSACENHGNESSASAAVPLHCKRSSKIYVLWKVERILSSNKSMLGIFPILEAHTGFVDSQWNRWHVSRPTTQSLVTRKCCNMLPYFSAGTSNRWERCSSHRNTWSLYCFLLYYQSIYIYILSSLLLICLSLLLSL